MIIRITTQNNRAVVETSHRFSTRPTKVEVFPVELFIYGETPSPQTDGAEVVFTTANNYRAGTLCVTRGTLRMYPTTDFSETSANTFTMVVAPLSNEPLIVDYIKQ